MVHCSHEPIAGLRVYADMTTSETRVAALYETAMHMKEAGKSATEICAFFTEESQAANCRVEVTDSGKKLEAVFPDEGQKIYFDGYNWHLVSV